MTPPVPRRSLATLCLAFALLACLALGGCVASRPYQTVPGPRPAADGSLPQQPPPAVPACTDPLACVVFVEFDDYGNLMNRAQFQATLQAAEAAAQAQGSVLLYVHGWHNDAAPGSHDVQGFQRLVERTARADRELRPDHPARGRTLGIYVGWRGDSIASRGPTLPLSYLATFWDRKSAAEAIGHSGGVYDLLSRLSELRRRHDGSRLLLHGHSFGAAVLHAALANTLMDQIRMDAADSSCAATVVERKLRSADADLLACPAGMAADLVLLLNPAFEAMRLRPQLDLARSLEYKPNLPPRLVVLTTAADWATQTAFPIGRSLGTAFDVYADAQSPAENVTAVGHHLPYVTHQLAALGAQACPADALPDLASLARVTDPRRQSLCVPAQALYPKAQPLLLRRCDAPGDCAQVAGAHHLRRGPVADGLVPYRMPLVNIRTTRDVSSGHGDIRNDTLENFVRQLLTLAIANPGMVPMAPR